MHTHLEQWAADAAAPREQLGVRCLAQGSHLSRGQFLPEPRFEPTTSGYKSNALSIRPWLPPSWGAHNEKAEAPHVSGGALKCAILISKIHRHWMSETLFTCRLPLCSSQLKPSLLSKSKNVHFMMAFKFKCSIQHLIS